MNTYSFDPMNDYQIRRQELLKEVAQYRLAKAVSDAHTPKVRSTSKFLALVERELASLGSGMVGRYGVQLETGITYDRQSNSGGC